MNILPKHHYLFFCAFSLYGCSAVHQARLTNGWENYEKSAIKCIEQMAPFLNPALEECDRKHQASDTSKQSMFNHLNSECKIIAFRENIRPEMKNVEKFDDFENVYKTAIKKLESNDIDLDAANSIISSELRLLSQNTVWKKHSNLAQCENRALATYVVPLSDFPSPFSYFMSEKLRIYTQLENGEISLSDAHAEVNKAWAHTVNTEQQGINSINSARQKQNSGHAINIMNSLGSQIKQQNQPLPTPRNTTCNKFGNTINCTSW